MATASISGLGSGLDTAGIVSQLMQLEAVPQSKLKSRVTSEESALKILQNLNSKVAALATKAGEVGKSTAWSSLTSTSSHEGVTATIAAGAAASSFTVDIQALATSHGETHLGTAAASDVLVPADADGKRLLTVTHQDGTTATVDAGDGTLRGIVDGLNATASGSGLRATMLQVSPGAYRLVVDAAATGAASSFTLTAADGSALLGGPEASRTRAGTDAQVEVSGFTLTSSSNTFTDLMPGVTVTLSAKAKVGETAQVEVTRDASTHVATIKSFVDGINALLSDIDAQSAYNATTKKAGVLAGESGVRELRTALATSLYPNDGSSMAALGLQVDRYGKLVFDEEKFATAYAADPTAVTQAFGSTDGFAARVQKVAEAASDKYDGTLTSAIKGRTDGISRLTDSITAWDLRLELRQNSLTRQFTALEVALSKMNSQSSWLAGQINSLSGSES
ncbi:flagellar filament capping protein FliD [Nocardioides jishulii]|uniref:Flagellar hook-associated protein 2 n=1 Tax=Nocardioides jishulii TaxID=2575440 RepID=A0A4U2YUW7_9ACTN|nr:flagellar filament capping protein FliD [Nocardioides jishulii]QCX28575.1 hypothetical protein FCL41_14320 [Nocardioides jishulii]TKI64532.1 hypothetical protein FC770_05255 [Nocardioides jishulii]